ncbi:hypothetical protein Tco_0375597 [Tanacetum coccineum]
MSSQLNQAASSSLMARLESVSVFEVQLSDDPEDKGFRFTYSVVIVEKWEFFHIDYDATAKPINLRCKKWKGIIGQTTAIAAAE